MFLHSLASGLVFLAGVAGLRLAVVRESWDLLALGLAIAVAGLAWLVLAGFEAPGGKSHGAQRQRSP